MLLKSLNSFVTWQQVLPLLGVPAIEQPMPMATECPLCHGQRLKIFDDTKFGGNWHHCQDCKSTGDMVALAAKVWELPIDKTLHKLADLGATLDEEHLHETAIQKYIQWHAGIQYEAARLIKEGTVNLHAGHIPVSFILQQAGFPRDQMQGDWPKRMGRFMGAAGRVRVLQAIFNRPHENDYSKLKKGGRVLVRGRGWENVVTIPFHTLPGQVSGWLFIGKRGHSHADHDFHALSTGSPGSTVDTGVCMYDVLDNPTALRREFGNHVFVFNDPIYAMRMQAKHLLDSELPLPLISTYNAKIKREKTEVQLICHDLWQSRPDKRFVFWGPELSTDLFNMAARCGGLVFVGPGPQHIKARPPHMWLKFIRSNAREWKIALAENLKRLPVDTAVTFLNSLDIGHDQMRTFLDSCPPKLRTTLENNRGQVQLLRTVRINNRDIMESERGWAIVGKRDELITNAIIRIDQVLVSDDIDVDPVYVGRILFDGEEYPYRVPLSKMLNTGLWLTKMMLVRASKLITVRQGWSKQLLDIARQFHNPQIICDDGRLGWRPADSCFRLPQFSIKLGGEVVEREALVIDEMAPGTALEPPSIAPDLSPLLVDTPASRLFWGAATCIGANILAPVVGQRPVGLGLIGQGALLVGRATARAFGCYEYRPGGNAAIRGEQVAMAIETASQRHRWPLLITQQNGMGSRVLFNPWFNGNYDRNAIVHMYDETHADMAATLGPWRFLRERHPVDAGPEVRMYGRYLIPVWLQWVLRKRVEIDHDAPYLQQINDKFAELMSSYGDPAVVEAGMQLIDEGSSSDDQRATHFVSMLWRFIESGALRFTHANDVGPCKVPQIILITGEDYPPSVFISYAVVDSMTAKRGIVVPDRTQVTYALQSANALDRVCEYNGEVGWLIVEKWWSTQIARFRSNQRLSIFGGAK